MIRLCFVCLGNICRSPTAEAVMSHLINERGLSARFEVDSAGTCAHHIGESPDSRGRAAAKKRGIQVSGAARQFKAEDYARFDYVIALDAANHRDLLNLTRNDGDRSKLHLLRDFDPDSPAGSAVPDPYYGGEDGFGEVLDLCEAACEGLLTHVLADPSA